MGDLTTDTLLEGVSSAATKLKALEVPEWGGTVYLRGLSVKDAERINSKGRLNVVDLLILGVCNANGEALLTKDHAEKLREAGVGVANRVGMEINRHSGIDEAEVKAAEEDFGGAQDDGNAFE